ncbi:hypothetical protein C8Q77DRAFT_1081356 [Trametes polyzona]|nr:hypothetical protein C8Q77DRAFT_1081356 [Trametes polyzona]
MSSFNVPGSSAGVFTSSVELSGVASSAAASSPSSVVAASSVSSAAAVSSSLASGSSASSVRTERSTVPRPSSIFVSASSAPLRPSAVPTLPSVEASDGVGSATSLASTRAVSSLSSSASARSRPGATLPLPLPISSTPEDQRATTVSSEPAVASSSVVARPGTASSSVLSLPASPSVSDTLPDKVVSSAAPANPSIVSSSASQHTAGRITVIAKPGTFTMAVPQSSSDAASSSESVQISASTTGSAKGSQDTTVSATGTRVANDPAPPAQTSARSSEPPGASNPVSSAESASVAPTSAAPTDPPAASSSVAISASHPADTESAAPAPAPAPASSVPAPTQDKGTSLSPTSVHAVSSPSIPTAPASHDQSRSTVPVEIPLPITKAAPAPVVHSTAAAPPVSPASDSDDTGAAAASGVPSSEPGPVLTLPPAQVKDVSHAPAGATATAAAASPNSKPEVDASPSPAPAPAPHAPVRPSATATFAPSDNDSEHMSGMVQANAQTQAPSGTTTSTITDQPETTLSSPFFVTVTDKNHHTTLSVPPVFTSMVVSELPDGQFTTYTHVIANPTGIYGVEIENKMGFFANSGLVAGVFLVVGIVAASILVGIWLFIRRRRRPRFIDTISRPLPMPENPFEDPRPVSPPEMRYRSSFTDSTLVLPGPRSGSRRSNDSRPAPRSPFEERQHRRNSSGGNRSLGRYNGLGLAAAAAHQRSPSLDSADGFVSTRSRYQSTQSGVVGLAITSDQRVDSSPSRRQPTSTSARSSPSMYPPTLPSLRNEHGEEDVGELVDVPLNRSGSSNSVHSITRKPVPSPEPDLEAAQPVMLPDVVISPTPRPPQPRPPIVPPRSPLRRYSGTTPTQPLSPPPYMKRTDTQSTPPSSSDSESHPHPPSKAPQIPARPPRNSLTLSLEMEKIVLQAFEPLTPPTSLASLSPAGSSAGHDPLPHHLPTPPGTAEGQEERASPFLDVGDKQLARAGPPGLGAQGFGLPMSPRKDTFYSRRGGSQGRPSIEWKSQP